MLSAIFGLPLTTDMPIFSTLQIQVVYYFDKMQATNVWSAFVLNYFFVLRTGYSAVLPDFVES